MTLPGVRRSRNGTECTGLRPKTEAIHGVRRIVETGLSLLHRLPRLLNVPVPTGRGRIDPRIGGLIRKIAVVVALVIHGWIVLDLPRSFKERRTAS